MKDIAVPVFMYHSIGIPNKNWVWNSLTCHYLIFEKHLKWFKKNNFSTIHLSDLYDYIFNDKEIPKNSVILTFDDGYGDNYVFAYPLLKKYGFKGTIFVNPEFVNPAKEHRKKLEEGNEINSLETIGFLSWNEMKEMEADGTIDIQSHALTHTWYPVADKIIDFRHLGDNYHWMTWNDYPDKKPFLQLDDKSLVNFGEPVYRHEKSLSARRYFPDDRLKKLLITYVEKNGAASFFNKPEWKSILNNKVEQFKNTNPLNGRFETEQEYAIRVRYELRESKKQLEINLNKKIEFLCWPGGSGTKIGVEIAEEVGYKMTTAARDISPKTRKRIQNRRSQKSSRIGRTSPVLNSSEYSMLYADDLGMKLRIASFRTNNYILKRAINLCIIAYSKLHSILSK